MIPISAPVGKSRRNGSPAAISCLQLFEAGRAADPEQRADALRPSDLGSEAFDTG
jgi:hypothetical protein